ncbi:ABC transporter substrate-binding protein [Halalkalibacter krulwichiae]|uniref:ABC transporter substrate-binding protein n=1 Tax=Halalkalibacter krulwichiae TaxID=199441 RepID=UPI0035300B5F
MKGLVIFSFVLTLLLSACSEQENEGAGQEMDSVKSNKELTLAIGPEPEAGFDPTTGWGRYGSPLFQSTLLKRDQDLEIVNDLAANYEVSEDGLTWTVTIRNDVRFSDGEPLTTEDVQFTFETAKSSGSVLDLTILDQVEVVDEHTVEFHLHSPQSTFVHSLITMGIVPKHDYHEGYAQNPVGSGPYKLIQWDKGQQLIVEVNDEYYDTKPFFEKITFLFLNEDAAFGAARSNQVDMAFIPASFSLQEVPGMRLEEIPSVDNRGIMFPYVQAGEKTDEGYPIGNDVTSDVAIRQAINLVINRQALVDGVLEGYGTPAYSVADQLPWWNAETVFSDNELKKAKALLFEAGWQDHNGDGMLEKDTVKAEFTLLYPSSDVTRQSLAITVADMIQSLGIHVNVEGKSWDEIEKLMHSNAVLMGWGSHDPIEMYHVYSGFNAGVDWFNPGYYHNPVVEQYLEQALQAHTEDEAIEYWKLAQWDGETGISANGDAPWAWLVNMSHLYLVADKLDIGKQKIQPHTHGWPITDNIVEWKWTE